MAEPDSEAEFAATATVEAIATAAATAWDHKVAWRSVVAIAF